jgi:phosphoglycolate phosphatase-like HAD superfamily hydrolase
MAYKAALFDLDDTLLVSHKAKWLQHQTFAKRNYGIDITDETLRQVWGMPFTAMIEKSYQGVDDPEVIRDRILAGNDEFPKGVFEGAVDAVSLLLDAGVHVGIVTSAPTRHALDDLMRLGFETDRLLCVHGDDVVVGHKPDATVFELALKLLEDKGVERHEVVYVGDLLIDLESAAAAGLDFIAVTTGLVEAQEFEAAGAATITPGITSAVEAILL